MSDEKLLGCWILGDFYTNVYTSVAMCGGEFAFTRDPKALPKIVVGIDYGVNQWWKVLAILWHEALEATFAKMNARFINGHSYANNSAAYMFMFDHQVFAEAVAAVAAFCEDVQPELEKVFRKQFDTSDNYDI